MAKNQINLAEEFKYILQQYSNEVFESVERGLDKASDYLVKKLEQKSPTDTGEFKKSWLRTTKYKKVRYIGNSRVNEQGIPLSNLIEFSKKGKPFIRKTFSENKENLIQIIKGEIENGNSK